jgi:hypothetical protein
MKPLKDSDDIKDLAITIVGNMVTEGIIKDCTDTDDDTEFTAQDIVIAALSERLGIKVDW